MTKKAILPKVLLVGRTNVGKSTIFNRLVGEKKSIVFDQEGVTRDYVQEPVTHNNVTFELIDTGGFSFRKDIDDISKKVQDKLIALLDKAAVICFICDAKNGIHQEDRKIAQLLHKSGKPVFLFLNKAENTSALEENIHDFYSLGFKNIEPLSAIHGRGVNTMLDLIVKNIPAKETEYEDEPKHKIVIIGRPNAGKSSLMNEILKQERSIVSDIAGTTREAISQNMFFFKDLIQLTDTAGVRKKARVDDDLEELMVKSSFAAVRDADTVVVMIDVSHEGRISDQELKLLFYCYEQKKNMLVIFNKIDLLDEYKKILLDKCIDEYKFIFDKIPQLWISCATKKNVGKVLIELQKIWARCENPFGTKDINEVLRNELAQRHLYKITLELKVYKAEVVPAPIPVVELYVNFPEWFGETELGCIENILRDNYDLKGCPIKLLVKKSRG